MQRDAMVMETGAFEGTRVAQVAWAGVGVRRRLEVVRRLRMRIAAEPELLARAVPVRLAGALSRNLADTMVAEVLPLVEALRFLEREAERILATRVLGEAGRPFWLGGVDSRVERVPWGLVLVLAPANYPLLLAGVQVVQALVAGNAVLWKPAPGTEAVALALRGMLVDVGLEAELLTVLDSSIESAERAIAAGVDHVVLTGAAETGKAVLGQLAESLTPATMELSGCDAVFVLPGADIANLIQALVFGLRLNGSFTCMAPRRVFLVGLGEELVRDFEARLSETLGRLEPVDVPGKTSALLREMVEDARGQGAEVLLDGFGAGVTLIANAAPSMRVMRTEVFVPVLSLMRVVDVDEALAANGACPYGLTASIFGPEKEARDFASRLRVGHVLINDVIASTADPRVPFGGRGRSGFGVTRGAEGLLGMTTARTVQSRRIQKRERAYEATGEGHVGFFAGLIQVLHGGGLGVRWVGLRRLLAAGRKLK